MAGGEPEVASEEFLITVLERETQILLKMRRADEARTKAQEALTFAEQGGRAPFLSGLLRARAYRVMAAVSATGEACPWQRKSLERWNELKADPGFTTVHERERKQTEQAISLCR